MEQQKEKPKPQVKVGDKMAEDLRKVWQTLPYGALIKIATQCNVSDEYVRQFFRGYHSITSSNIKILNAADKILDKELAIEQLARKKAVEILNKSRL